VTDTDTAEKPDVVGPPRTIVAAFALTIAHVVLSIVNSAMLWGYQDYLRGQLVKSNNKLKLTDKHRKDYSDTPKGLHNLNHDLHSGLNVGLIQIVIFSLLVVLLAVNFRKGRGWARWAEILVLVIVVQAPFRLLNLGGDAPVLMRLVSALVGLTGLAIIVLLVLPKSSQYFAAVRGVTVGDRRTGAAAMGFRGLFGPRRPPVDDDADDVASARASTRSARSTGSAGSSGSSTKSSSKPSTGTAAQPVRRPTKPVQTKPVQTKPVQTKPVQTKAAGPPPDDAPTAAPERRPAKAKIRAGVDTYADPTAAQSATSDPAAPARSTASKSRGKSRRGS
jgi:hypothetical protein